MKNKPIFKTQYDERDRKHVHPGNPVKVTYSGRYDSKGRVVLEETGKVDLYAEIQSHKDSTDINKMVERFVRGDTTALSRAQGFFADVTQMPTNLAETLNQIRACEDAFNALPVEVKAKFNHNVTEFLASAGSPEFMAALGLNQQSAAAPEVKEDVKNES